MYAQFIRFLAPLILAMVAQGLSVQFLNGGMARVPQAIETLAAFGLAYGLITVMSGPLHQSRQLGLAMIDNEGQLRTGTRTVVVIGIALSLATAILGLGGPGRWIVQDLHGIESTLADQAQTAMLWLIPLPLVSGLSRYYSGLLAHAWSSESGLSICEPKVPCSYSGKDFLCQGLVAAKSTEQTVCLCGCPGSSRCRRPPIQSLAQSAYLPRRRHLQLPERSRPGRAVTRDDAAAGGRDDFRITWPTE